MDKEQGRETGRRLSPQCEQEGGGQPAKRPKLSGVNPSSSKC